MPISSEIDKKVDFISPRQWIDSHCHFDFDNFDSALDLSREEHWQMLVDYGCKGLVIPGISANRWPELISLCEGKPWAFALGLHPYFFKQHKRNDREHLRAKAQELVDQPNSQLVAIGEFGLDFMLADGHSEQQMAFCQSQFEIAQQLDLPVILHVRKAYDDITAMMRRLSFSQGGIVHAFSGSVQQGQKLIELGFKLGIGGAMSHPRANKLRASISQLPKDSLVLETDAPDMRPGFWQDSNNSPLSLLFLAQIFARLHQLSLDEVIFMSNNNLLAALPRLEQVLAQSEVN
jgi:TatD DNase family protein